MLHGIGLQDVLGRKSFEEHCDQFLLGSDRSQTQNEPNRILKQMTEQQRVKQS